MPTKRAWSLFVLAAVLYFLANQTQVGWLYIITDALIGVLVVAAVYSRGMLNQLQVTRTLGIRVDTGSSSDAALSGSNESDRLAELDLSPPTFHEDNSIEIGLHFQQVGLLPGLLVSGLERCPFAPLEAQEQTFFLPALFKGQTLHLSYQTVCDRRGLYAFAPMRLASNGPFGLFRTRRTLAVSGELLIYPAYYPLNRLRLFEKKGLAEQPAPRIGQGSQVISTREYRSGDSPRQIHWRSTARTGQLVVKEFSDDAQQNFTVVLDLQTGSALGEGKFSTFETALRLAASLGYYAIQKNIPFQLAGASPRWTPPSMPLGWWGLLNYLAKVQNDGHEPLAQVLRGLPVSNFTIVLVSRPHESIIKRLAALAQPSRLILAIFITPDGVLPAMAESLKKNGLEVKSASPHNWVEILTEL